jgi:hypothetical protein
LDKPEKQESHQSILITAASPSSPGLLSPATSPSSPPAPHSPSTPTNQNDAPNLDFQSNIERKSVVSYPIV